MGTFWQLIHIFEKFTVCKQYSYRNSVSPTVTKDRILIFELCGTRYRFCQVQPKPQLSWAHWLYFQLIQPLPPQPGKVYISAGPNSVSKVKQIIQPQYKQATQKLVGSKLKLVSASPTHTPTHPHPHLGKFISQQELTQKVKSSRADSLSISKLPKSQWVAILSWSQWEASLSWSELGTAQPQLVNSFFLSSFGYYQITQHVIFLFR